MVLNTILQSTSDVSKQVHITKENTKIQSGALWRDHIPEHGECVRKQQIHLLRQSTVAAHPGNSEFACEAGLSGRPW